MRQHELDVAKIMPVFFKAMVRGYANSNPEKFSIPLLPETRIIFYEELNFKVVDYYTLGNDNWSFGTTVIHCKNIPVWIMQYRGKYPKELTPFLKRALKEAYVAKDFLGGRGPSLYSEYGDSALTYSNHFVGDFTKFKGTEEIFPPENSKSPTKMGSLEYSGGLLL